LALAHEDRSPYSNFVAALEPEHVTTVKDDSFVQLLTTERS